MTVIRIDHDIPFESYNTEHLKGWLKRLPYPVDEVWIRPSTGGNTHVKVIIPGEISDIDTLLIRAVLRDDPRRLRGDMERYLFDSPIFGLLFDEKKDMEKGITLKVGKWMRIR